MIDYLSKCYQNIKVGVAGVSAVLSIVTTVVGFNIGVLPLAITGGLSLVTSFFVVFDTVASWSVIKADVDRLQASTMVYASENKSLRSNIETLNATNNNINQENKRLHEISKKNEEDVNRLMTNNNVYLSLLKNHEEMLVSEQEKNNELSNILTNMRKEITETKDNIKILENVKEGFLKENERLMIMNNTNEELIIQFKEQLENILIETQEVSIDINESSDDINENYENTLSTLMKIVSTVKEQAFCSLDSDGNGIITRKEFNEYVKK
mgnify:CR=1 FL=1